ncbi:hypothetical protein [Fischerella sp. JS2]|uniref:hypothetical protein n=1 Tax=Fischerella sp. JS2 TaxID=2597771 RepID=UPI0028E54CB5|nr:hypothetical protein [Fischerella sp. JS2]
MLKIKLNSAYLLGLAFTIGLMGATTTPVSAQQVIVIDQGGFYGVTQPPIPTVGSFIYGSPIATPMPVDPVTGLMLNRSIYNTYPKVHHNIPDNVLVNPVLVNPKIRNSTLINPVIVKDSWYHNRPIQQPIIIQHP